jgi:hypothetical protein
MRFRSGEEAGRKRRWAPAGLDGAAGRVALVTAKVVEDDVAGRERRDEDLLERRARR